MQSYLPDDYTFLSYIQKPGLAEDFFTLQCGRTGLRDSHIHEITYPMGTAVEYHYPILFGPAEQLVA